MLKYYEHNFKKLKKIHFVPSKDTKYSLPIDSSIHTKLQNTYIHLYEDSGLWDEEIIVQNYISRGNELRKRLIQLCEKTFSQETILGRISDTKHLIFFENKILIVTYAEDFEEKIRYIDEIIIARR